MINLLKKNYNSPDTNPIFAHRHMSRKILFLIMASVSSISIYGQTNTISSKELAGQLNTVTTMVPFITITPDSRSAGMGDVLSGVIAGLLAQGVILADAAKLGVWLHAKAADEAVAKQGERGLMASDLMPYLRQQINKCI